MLFSGIMNRYGLILVVLIQTCTAFRAPRKAAVSEAKSETLSSVFPKHHVDDSWQLKKLTGTQDSIRTNRDERPSCDVRWSGAS
jgi:hypothetical protein